MSETTKGPDHGHSHVALHGEQGPLSEDDRARQRRATRIMMLVLIPIGIWTLVAMIVMWPGDVSGHLRDNGTFSQPDVTLHDATVLEVRDIANAGQPGTDGTGEDTRPAGELTVQLDDGPETGQQVIVSVQPAVYASGVEVGETVKVYRVPIEGLEPSYQFTDFDRTVPLLVLLLAFGVALVAVARKRGALALVGLGFSAFIVVKFMFPALIAGSNPVAVALAGGSAILFVVLYVTHGFSVRTTTALLGTLFGMLVATILGWLMVQWAHLTGVASEDDTLLWSSTPDMQLTGVVICAIIITAVGVLNDVTITQASAVWELSGSDADESRLFSRAMRIGRDHIASSTYTIAFAATGASLATYLMMIVYNRPLLEVIGMEEFSMEIISTLVGALAVILAMPLTTAIGVAVVSASRDRRGELAPVGTSDNGRDELLDLDTNDPNWSPASSGSGRRLPKLPRPGGRTTEPTGSRAAGADDPGPKPKRQA
ncbi:YibE/F family protein [Naumannella halotolerans]|uniref:YibE/F-like protein n=1 Tax=Naumannella halotolerans TaxID=993414 RepID=A0A4R7J235_9ACTN|nr:YibE/F family protein [Naumannella halotolerans]TDT31241.1 YibE/F-like protein [Naumannella halotolerans]